MRIEKQNYQSNDKLEVFLAKKGIIEIMCIDYEFPEVEKDLMNPIKEKRNIETEKLEEKPLTVTA